MLIFKMVSLAILFMRKCNYFFFVDLAGVFADGSRVVPIPQFRKDLDFLQSRINLVCGFFRDVPRS